MSLPEPAHDPAEPADTDLAARREHSLMALVELGRALDLRLNERELAQLALFNLVGHFGAPHAALWLRPEGGGPPEPAAAVGLPADAAQALAAHLGDLPAVWPAGELVRLSTAGWLGGFADLAPRTGLAAIARLEGQDDWLGYVALSAPRTRRFYDAVECELIAASLGIVSAAIENQRLVRSLHRGHAELAAANARMQELDQARSEMLQNLNHEFRTPIAVILGAASCLREPSMPEVQRQRFVEMIEKQAAQARDMFTMLLDHAELMSVRAEIACEPADLAGCVREVLAARSKALVAARREVEVVVTGEPLLALVDPERVRRVIDELVTNALKFSPAETPITIRAGRLAREGGALPFVEVVDRGRGMTAAERDVAFQLFRQGDGSSTRTAGGLGVGLPACQRIVELMGGSLVLESEFGRGTTARVTLRPAASR